MKIIITGSSVGIGRAIAKKLLSNDHQVWGVARRDQSDLKALYPANFHSTQTDVADWNQVEKLVSNISSMWGSVDALITCAGLQGEIAPLEETNPAQWSHTVTSNINGTFFSIRGFYDLLIKSAQKTKIICFSGGGATKSRPYFSAYAAAKTAIVRLIETAADEWKDQHIDINAVAPGRINTAMMDEIIAKGPGDAGIDEYAAALKQKADGKDSLPEVLLLVEWLLSSKSNGITGKIISAPWDRWEEWSQHLNELKTTDIYTLRRITGKERGSTWGDK